MKAAETMRSTMAIDRRSAPTRALPLRAEARQDLGRLFDELAPRLLAFVERVTSGDNVEDIVQEVFLTAHRRLDALPKGGDARAWLYGIALNLVRHQRRSIAR